jgi:protein-S-isoprenylcysteine O-methyltransferase Ste14
MAEPATDNAGVKFHPPVALLIVVVLCLAAEYLLPLPRFPAPHPAFLILGVTIAVAGFLLGASGVWRFLSLKVHPSPTRSVPRLVTGGPYRFTRNPMYLGMIVMLTGVALTFGSFAFLAGALAMFLYFSFYVIPREEAYMTRKFGKDYTDFRARVRRWL